jgi:hypothetical protein
VVVTAPDPMQLDEALYFYEQLGERQQVAVGGFVVNRVHPNWVPEAELKRPTVTIANELAELEDGAPTLSEDERSDLAERLRANAAEFYVLAAKDAASLIRLREEIPPDTPMVQVPFFAQDIHTLDGLNRVRVSIFGS